MTCGISFSVVMALVGAAVAPYLPFWLGGKADIAPMSSAYFLIYSLTLPAVLVYHLTAAMLKSAGEMRVPSALSIMMCCLDVVFNYLFIYILGLGVTGAALGTMTAYILIALPMSWPGYAEKQDSRPPPRPPSGSSGIGDS